MAEQHDPSTHKMTRRSIVNDYSLPGMYHITLRVAEGMVHPFGRVVGNASVADGNPDAPRVELSTLGEMVKHELLNSIRSYYPMVEVQDYVIMPEHMHFIIEVHEPLISRQGRKVHLGQVIAGFKKGCNRRYWEITGLSASTDERRGACPAVYPRGYKVPSNASTGRQPLFSEGYVDVMPLHRGQLAQQRRYIHNNPRSRLLRSTRRDLLQPQRGGIDTALSVNALIGYLKRECAPWQITPEVLAVLTSRLKTTEDAEKRRGNPADTDGSKESADTDGSKESANTDGSKESVNTDGRRRMIDCDSYGNRGLLQRRLLPVVCHRRDKDSFEYQKARCLSAAQEGAVMVSARIAEGEQIIMDEVIALGFPVVLILDNGMPEIYHPSESRIEQCLAERLLIVTPWQYHYRLADEAISVVECKSMNCVVQALCRMKDDWWKQDE